MLGYVFDIFCFQPERFGGFQSDKGGRGRRQPLNEGSPETPREKLIAAEVSRAKHAATLHSVSQNLATLQVASHHKQHSLNRISLSSYLHACMHVP